LLGSLDAEMFAAWRKPKAPVRQAALVKATLLKWTARRDRLRVRGKTAVDDADIAMESLLAWVNQCQEVKVITVFLEKQYGTGLTVQQVLDRIAVDAASWMVQQANSSTAAAAGESAFAAAGVGTEEAAFAAGYAAAEKKQRRPGPYVPSSKRTPGQCMEHQFGSSGCTKDNCQYQHDPAQLGKYADTADSSGNKACMYFAVLGKCTDEGCERAHIRVPGARGNPKRCVNILSANACVNWRKPSAERNWRRRECSCGVTAPKLIAECEVTAPKLTATEVTAPKLIAKCEVTAPKLTATEVTVPKLIAECEVTAPKLTATEVTVPKLTETEVTVPKLTAECEVTAPELTATEVTVPKLTVADESDPWLVAERAGWGAVDSVGAVVRDCGLEIRAVGETEWESRCETEVTLAATETTGSVVVMDSACTVCIIGQNEIAHVSEVWDAPLVFIRTAQGVTSSSKQGRLSTAHGDFVGYIVPESEYSLWSLETEMQGDGVYTQSKHTAEMRYSDGTVRQYYKKNRMWVVDVRVLRVRRNSNTQRRGTHTIHSVNTA